MGKDPLFVNKVAGAVIGAGLIAMMTGFVSGKIYHPEMPETPGFAIAADAAGSAPVQTAAVPTGPVEIGPLLAAADIESGKKVARKCTSCHTFEQGGPNKIGPNLWNMVGAQPAAVEGFRYSSAMRGMEVVWDFEELNKFLYRPRDYLPGTKMTYAGLRKDQDRADLIAYMRSLSDNPKPLP